MVQISLYKNKLKSCKSFGEVGSLDAPDREKNSLDNSAHIFKNCEICRF